MSRPKSTRSLLSRSRRSGQREDVDAHADQVRRWVRRLLDEGGHAAVPGDVEDAEPMRLFDRHGSDRAGDVRALLPMHLEEGAIVHLVDVVAGEDQHELRIPVGDEVQVLEDGVGGAAIPVARPPATDERLQQRDAAAAAVEVPRPADADVVDQGAGRVLGQDPDVGEPRVHGIAQREVDDPVLAAERHARLCPHLRQDAESLALAAGEDQRQGRARHGPILGPGASQRGESPSAAMRLRPTAGHRRHRRRRRRLRRHRHHRRSGVALARLTRSAPAWEPDARPAHRTPTGTRVRRSSGAMANRTRRSSW